MVMDVAKKAFQALKLGKSDGPPLYTSLHKLPGVNLNKSEKEALNLNFGALWVTWAGLDLLLVDLLFNSSRPGLHMYK